MKITVCDSDRGQDRSVATWGQQYMVRALEPHFPNDGWTNGGLTIPVNAPDNDVELASRVGKALSNFDSFRTRFDLGRDDELQQICLTRVEVELLVVEPGESSAAQFRSERFDFYTQPLFRVGLMVALDNKAVLMVAWSHLVSDAWSSRVIESSLKAELEGRTNRLDQLIQPIDRSRWEISTEGISVSERSVRRWIARSGPSLAALPMNQEYMTESRSRFLIGSLVIGLSGPLECVVASRQFAATDLTALACELVAQTLAVDTLPFFIRTANRTGRQGSVIAPTAQEAPAEYSTGSLNSMGGLSSFGGRLLGAQRNGAYDSRQLERMFEAAGVRPVPQSRRVIINCHEAKLTGWAETATTAERHLSSFEWVGGRTFDPVMAYVDVFPAEHKLSFMIDTALISRGGFEGALSSLLVLSE